jgi:hypothetical protein
LYSLLLGSAYGILLFKAKIKCGDPKRTMHEIKQLSKNDFNVEQVVDSYPTQARDSYTPFSETNYNED